MMLENRSKDLILTLLAVEERELEEMRAKRRQRDGRPTVLTVAEEPSIFRVTVAKQSKLRDLPTIQRSQLCIKTPVMLPIKKTPLQKWVQQKAKEAKKRTLSLNRYLIQLLARNKKLSKLLTDEVAKKSKSVTKHELENKNSKPSQVHLHPLKKRMQ